MTQAKLVCVIEKTQENKVYFDGFVYQ